MTLDKGIEPIPGRKFTNAPRSFPGSPYGRGKGDSVHLTISILQRKKRMQIVCRLLSLCVTDPEMVIFKHSNNRTIYSEITVASAHAICIMYNEEKCGQFLSVFVPRIQRRKL